MGQGLDSPQGRTYVPGLPPRDYPADRVGLNVHCCEGSLQGLSRQGRGCVPDHGLQNVVPLVVRAQESRGAGALDVLNFTGERLQPRRALLA